MARGGTATEARLNLDCTCAGWSGLNCILWAGCCIFFYGMTAFVLFSFVKIQKLMEEDDEFLAPGPADDAGLGYG